MSLTKILNTPAVRAALADRIRMPAFPWTRIRAPVQAEDPSRLGIAFDYALRFGLHSHGWADEPRTVASRATDALRRRPDTMAYAVQARDICDAAATALATMQPGELTADHARACFDLVGLDVVCRAARVEQIGRTATQRELDDLVALFAITPWEGFRPAGRLALNPSFGEGSRAIGGADADLILDDTLIEIKVIAESTVQINAVSQLVGYTLLARRFGIEGVELSSPIDQIGVYLARCGALVTAPMSEVISPSDEAVVLDLIMAAGAQEARRRMPIRRSAG